MVIPLIKVLAYTLRYSRFTFFLILLGFIFGKLLGNSSYSWWVILSPIFAYVLVYVLVRVSLTIMLYYLYITKTKEELLDIAKDIQDETNKRRNKH